MASGFEWRPGNLEFNVRALDAKVHYAVSAVIDYNAAVAEGQMKSEARWTDRTTAARSGLHAQAFDEPRAWTLILAHSVAYGIWLETRNDFHGKYAIILPVLIDAGNRIMAQLEGLFRKMA